MSRPVLRPMPYEIVRSFFDNVDHLRGDNTTVDLTYTYANDKYICMREFYFFHVWSVYFVCFAALGCFITIMIPQIKWMHAWFGRLYIVFMILATGTALLIFNNGLPGVVLVSFFYTMVGIVVGWLAIKLHQAKLHHAAVALVETRLGNEQRTDASFKLQEAVAAAKKDIEWAKTTSQRFLSYKALHGVMMFWSWESLGGRLFSSNQSGDFTCYTYPTYKAVNSDQYATEGMTLEGVPISFVSIEDPKKDELIWNRLGGDWAFMALAFVVPIVVGTIVGVLFSVWAAGRENPALKSPVEVLEGRPAAMTESEVAVQEVKAAQQEDKPPAGWGGSRVFEDGKEDGKAIELS